MTTFIIGLVVGLLTGLVISRYSLRRYKSKASAVLSRSAFDESSRRLHYGICVRNSVKG